MPDDPLLNLLRATAPRAFCLRCLGEAFPSQRDVRQRIDEALARGEPIQAQHGRCSICGDQRSVVQHKTPAA